MATQRTVMTVLGPISADELGTTLMHEHIFCSLIEEYRGDGWLNDGVLAVDELNRFRQAGGGTIVDLTLRGMGRRPADLRAVSERTGLHVIAGTGLYRHQYYDAAWIDQQSVSQLAEWIERELTEGIEDTGVRAGIIGEIGCDEFITAQEERVFRAAARAQKRTGVAISTHAGRWPVGHVQLDLLEEEGVDPRRVIIGHCDSVASSSWNDRSDAMKYHETLAARGAWVSFDHFGSWGSEHDDRVAIDYVMNLVSKGLASQVLLSHDVCFRSSLHAHGGNGYDFIPVTVVPRLRAAGLVEAVLHTLLVENPARALTGPVR